jgi:hypothetical protein
MIKEYCNRCKKELEAHEIDHVHTSADGVIRDYCTDCYDDFKQLIEEFDVSDW